MTLKQPRVPEYRQGEELRAYLRTLILFLKDFCQDVWSAVRQADKRIEALEKENAQLKERLAAVSEPVDS